jgi:hypothetical protein
VHGAARSSSGPDRRRAAGVGAPNKRVGPALLESGAGKARQSVVSGRRGGGSGGGGGSCRSRGRGGKEGRMRCAPGPIGHPSPGGRSGRIGKTDTMRVAGRGRTGGSGGAIGPKKKNEERVGGGVRIHPENARMSGRHGVQYVAQCVACAALTPVVWQ